MKRIDKHEFLPSAIEIVERPPSPLGALVIWIISFFVLAGVVWSIFGRVDVVASARGRVIHEGRLKVIQPLEEGIVKKILVEEGQDVVEGELLVELDSTVKRADSIIIGKTLMLYTLERDIREREVEGRSITLKELLEDHPDLERGRIVSEYNYYLSREREYRGSLEEMKIGIIQGEAQVKEAEARLVKIENQIDLYEVEEKNYRYLKEIGGVRESEWRRIRNELETLVYDAEAQRHRIKSLETEIEELREQLRNMHHRRGVQLADELVELEKNILTMENELIKTEKGLGLKKLYSPVEGRVNEVGVSTVGGVVKPGEALITVVPLDSPLQVELLVLNRDIGFVEEGQRVEIKMDTFPFQKHGTMKGRVEKISPDAFEDERGGLLYRVEVAIDENNMMNDGQPVILGSGMTLTGEIKTGRRRIVEFFLSPLMKYADEGLKVR